MIKSLPFAYAPRPLPRARSARLRSVRYLVAAALYAASAGLSRLATILAREEDVAEVAIKASVIEFYAEAGAPEGAIYADGVLVGFLPGVKRL